jgi:hypothetical protein
MIRYILSHPQSRCVSLGGIDSRMEEWSTFGKSSSLSQSPFKKGYIMSAPDTVMGMRLGKLAVGEKEDETGRLHLPAKEEEQTHRRAKIQFLRWLLDNYKARLVDDGTDSDTVMPSINLLAAVSGKQVAPKLYSQDLLGAVGQYADPKERWGQYDVARHVDDGAWDDLVAKKLYSPGYTGAGWGISKDGLPKAASGSPAIDPVTGRRMADLVATQYLRARGSGDSDVRRFAKLLGNMAGWWSDAEYNSLDPKFTMGGRVYLPSPDMVLRPTTGAPGNVVWHELTHAADKGINAMNSKVKTGRLNTDRPPYSWSLRSKDGLFDAIGDDAAISFYGAPEEIRSTGKALYDQWRGSDGKESFADYYYPIQMLNTAYHIASNGEESPGVLGAMDAHSVDPGDNWDKKRKGVYHTEPEAFVSLTNGYMTGSRKANDFMKQNFPHAKKKADEIVKEGLDIYDDYYNHI